MPSVSIGRVDIHHEIVGTGGPWIAVVPGGRHPLGDVTALAEAISERGYRVVIHDRRNCGQSSFDFSTRRSEDAVWAQDLAGLLHRIGATPAVVVGKSRGGRVAVDLALDHPGAVRGLVLWGLSGGAAAVKYLDGYYYRAYLRAAKRGGMEAVSALDPFLASIADRPDRRETLMAIKRHQFISAMRRRRRLFLATADHPVIGLADERLQTITVPTAVIRYYDQLHPHDTALHAVRHIPDARYFDFDPNRRDDRTMTGAVTDVPTVARIVGEFERTIDR